MALVIYTGGGNSLLDVRDSSEKKTEGIFVGLSNQGATCYLNGLLQTLFMTPEFRRAIFTWHYDETKDGAAEHCIPLQLQRLFGFLQLSKTKYVDTKDLTKSFGWEGSEVFQQQDVQELTRVLFDALEDTFKGTEVENIIDQIYAGELIDYLRCIDVDYRSERVDKFLDFSLAIVPFGTNKAMRSLNECIEMFLRPEILDGENKYYAESVSQKVDAIKGLKFGKLPQIMSVQLKRFVYDFTGPDIIQKKLNDIVRFPMILDMNKYVSRKNLSRSRTSSASNAVRTEEVATSTENEKENNIFCSSASSSEIENYEFEDFLQQQMAILRKQRQIAEEKSEFGDNNNNNRLCDSNQLNKNDDGNKDDADVFDENADDIPDLVDCLGNISPQQLDEEKLIEADRKSMTREEIINLVSQRGEWVYELYAVLIHSGAIAGGHYYAYIKDLDTQKWWDFNDSHVTLINEDKVREAWGDMKKTSSTYYGKTISTSSLSCANAYMLMYRKVSICEPISFPDNSLVPEYIKDAVRKIDEENIAKEKEEEARRNRLELKISWNSTERIVFASKMDTYESLLCQIFEEFNLGQEPVFATMPTESRIDENDNENANASLTNLIMNPSQFLNRIRLRSIDFHKNIKTDIFDPITIGSKNLLLLGFYNLRKLALEVRAVDEEWEIYHSDGATVSIEIYNPICVCFETARVVRLPKEATLLDLKKEIASWVEYGIGDMRVMKIFDFGSTDARCEELLIESKKIKSEYYLDNSKVFVEEATTAILSDSLALAAYVNRRNFLNLKINRPPSNDFLEVIKADARWSVKRLRMEIAEHLSLSEDNIRMFRGSLVGSELKDSGTSLSLAVVYNNSVVAISIGKSPPNGLSAISMSIYTHPYNKPGIVILPEIDSSSSNDLDFDKHIRGLALEGVDDKSVLNCKSSTDFIPIGSESTWNTFENKLDDDDDDDDDLLEIKEADVIIAANYPGAIVSDELDPETSNQLTTTTTATAVLMVVGEVENGHQEKKIEITDDIIEEVEPNNFGEITIEFSSKDCHFETPKWLEPFYVCSTTSVDSIRENFAKQLVEMGKMSAEKTFSHIRIREKNSSFLGNILRGSRELCSRYESFWEGRQYCLQILDEPENLPPLNDGDVIIYVQRWIRKSWTLGDRIEVSLSGDMTVKEISQRLGILTNIPFENMRALIVPIYLEIKICNLNKKSPFDNTYTKQEWFVPSEISKQLHDLPCDLKNSLKDGALLLVYDALEPLRELTMSDKLSLEIVEAASKEKNNYYYNNKTTYASTVSSDDFYTIPTATTASSPKPRGNSGVRIKTHKERIKEQQQRGNSDPETGNGNGNGNGNVTEPINLIDDYPEAFAEQSNGGTDHAEIVKNGGYDALFSDLM